MLNIKKNFEVMVKADLMKFISLVLNEVYDEEFVSSAESLANDLQFLLQEVNRC